MDVDTYLLCIRAPSHVWPPDTCTRRNTPIYRLEQPATPTRTTGEAPDDNKMHFTESFLEFILQNWAVVGGVAVVAWLTKNRFNNGLNKYPGPFVASLTDWWRFVDVWGRRPDITHRKLHDKYGDVVRLGPNSLSFADPEALKTIYGLNKGFIKVQLRKARPHLTLT